MHDLGPAGSLEVESLRGRLEPTAKGKSRHFAWLPTPDLVDAVGILSLSEVGRGTDGYLVQEVDDPADGTKQYLLLKTSDPVDNAVYEVTLWPLGAACTCTDALARKRVCKHAQAMRKIAAAEGL